MTALHSLQLKLAKRYAKALSEFDDREQIYDDLKKASDKIAVTACLKYFLELPMADPEDKKIVMDEAFEGVCRHTMNFLCLLADKNRISYIDAVVEELRKKLDEINNILRIEVFSAVELLEDEKLKLKEKLEKKLGCGVELDYTIDKNIVAGLVIKIGDQVIDDSLRSRFEAIKRQLS